MSANEPVAPPRSGGSAKTIAAVLVLIAFMSGALVGVVGDRIYLFHHRGRFPGRALKFVTARIVSRLDRELHLSPDQRRAIEQILERHSARIANVWAGVHSQVRKEIEQTNGEIEQVLTPDQREKFGKMKMHMAPHRSPRASAPGTTATSPSDT